jgi:hypothetical protein
MSVGNSGSESPVAMLAMFVFVGLSSGASCMMVVVGGFLGVEPFFPTGAEAS